MVSQAAGRILRKVGHGVDRFLGPLRQWRLSGSGLARNMGAKSIDDLWDTLLKNPSPAMVSPADAAEFRAASPVGAAAILSRAGDVLIRRVNLATAGALLLPQPVSWSLDYKTSHIWPKGRFSKFQHQGPAAPGDVKIPWELSRQQWLIPLGQAYVMTGEERYAQSAREYIEDWLDHNPYGATVNWGSASEAAMRVFTWNWLFHAIGKSEAWGDGRFRARFLQTIHSHGVFIEKRVDRRDMEGIHYLVCAAGLVFAGLFFGRGREPERWEQAGWGILENEIDHQFHADGVSRENSTAFHRLATEVFLYTALYRQRCNRPAPELYKERLRKMGAYILAYSRPDGQPPLFGEGDGARMLPFRFAQLDDHRYLAGIIGLMTDDGGLCARFSGPRDEVFWVLGSAMAQKLPESFSLISDPSSVAFREGGVFIMKNKVDHLFINCGPMGDGGNGHNDLLSFEAYLDGVSVISDSGAYGFEAPEERSGGFRKTAFHSTPMVNGEEINPEPGAGAGKPMPMLYNWTPGERYDLFSGSHTGYHRLSSPVTVKRTIVLDKALHGLIVEDSLTGSGIRNSVVPFHVSAGFSIKGLDGNMALLTHNGSKFLMAWRAEGWAVRTVKGWMALRYGVKQERPVVEFYANSGPRKLLVVIIPANGAPDSPIKYAMESLEKLV